MPVTQLGTRAGKELGRVRCPLVVVQGPGPANRNKHQFQLLTTKRTTRKHPIDLPLWGGVPQVVSQAGAKPHDPRTALGGRPTRFCGAGRRFTGDFFAISD
jgi:hypothetical protein